MDVFQFRDRLVGDYESFTRSFTKQQVGDIYGDGYPSETFRVFKNKEIRQYGEYRTRRLVLDAWVRLASGMPQMKHRHATTRSLDNPEVVLTSGPIRERTAPSCA